MDQTVYVGVVGAEIEYGVCRDSIHQIIMRPGDCGPNFARATKGYDGRNWHVKQFLAGQEVCPVCNLENTLEPKDTSRVCKRCGSAFPEGFQGERRYRDYILFLDSDMVFDPDTLERLRAHNLPYVSGLYMRRQYAPIAPIWFESNPGGEWPFLPWVGPIERGKLHEIGASGWGCVLVHRDVFQAMEPLLMGEPYILEDALTVWPYDTEQLFDALNAGDLDGVRQILRPLRGVKHDITGSDIRFPFFARQAGFTLYGDPDVRPGHLLLYPLSPNDYDALPVEVRNDARGKGVEAVARMRDEWRARVNRLGGAA